MNNFVILLCITSEGTNVFKKKKRFIQFLTEVFRNVKQLMPQSYKEMIYKCSVSSKGKKKTCRLPSSSSLSVAKILCFCLQNVNIFLC